MDPVSSSDTSSEHIHDGNSDEILRVLSTVYWEGVEREICELVLAYQDIEKYQAQPTTDEENEVDLSSCNFQRFCTLLSM
ncbi:hypothetical protein IG631_10661 [Alternaria alternata]|nr:hypothetical protein IG631_10661 [Alternaria alternata]